MLLPITLALKDMRHTASFIEYKLTEMYYKPISQPQDTTSNPLG